MRVILTFFIFLLKASKFHLYQENRIFYLIQSHKTNIGFTEVVDLFYKHLLKHMGFIP